MSIIYQYRVWCTTDSKYVYTWADTDPTDCPENTAHSIDTTKTAIVATTGEEGPSAADGKRYVTPDLFAEGTSMQWIGAGDHPVYRGRGEKLLLWTDGTAGTTGSTSATVADRKFTVTDETELADVEVDDLLTIDDTETAGDDGTYRVAEIIDNKNIKVDRNWPTGNLSSLTFTTAKNVSKTFSYNDWIELAGGECGVSGGKVGDYIQFEVYAPATPVTSNPGSGDCNVVSGVIVPAAGDGQYDVDLTQAVPIPSKTKPSDNPTGYWEWDKPDMGKGTVTAGTPGASLYHLIAAEYKLAEFAAKKWIVGEECDNLVVPAIKPKTILPHWNLKITLHNCGHNGSEGWGDGLQFYAVLLIARAKTTPCSCMAFNETATASDNATMVKTP